MTAAGTWLGGRYELLSVIGRGGMAEVWKARDHRLGRDVAIKRLRADLASDDTFQARFQREAQSAAGLNHPNIVSVYDTGEAVDDATGLSVPYIVMELVEGHTLRDVLRDDRKILPARALEFTEGVLDALSYSHAAGIVHRDIKPANVMLTESGQVKVMDFGIARAVADTSATMTQTAAVIGTAQYLSPEQARGEKVDNRADIYATGCLLYELLVGRPPFIGDSPVSVAYQHVREIPAPPSSLDPEITPEMDAVTLKALAKAPADRYQTATQMHQDIERVLKGVPPLAPMVTRPANDPESAAATQVISPAAAADNVATAVRPVEPNPTGVDAYPVYQPGTGTQAVTRETQTPVSPATASRGEEPDTRRKKRWPIVLLVVLAAAVLGVGGYFGYQLFGGPSPSNSPSVAMVKVPAVTGMSEQGARSVLSNAGLRTKITHVRQGADTAGQVVSQNPAGGRSVAANSEVTITINDGPKKITVPSDLIGMTEAQAKSALVSAGFAKTDINVTYQQTSEADEGTVISSSPNPGQQASDGDSITIVVAQEAPTATTTVTNNPQTSEPTRQDTGGGQDTGSGQPSPSGTSTGDDSVPASQPTGGQSGSS
ncbi:Serine/threonine-protein kinase pknB [Acidipropionibacterium jensenii]|uniref:non-specific serine/threonine protein kinase n=3 Tax=Acidipropionibacterium jensenii TaxID=1749 RepID=A0A448NYK2_9ACTN|nr:Stk1 family PASTA domain-containing Ser/Thr kinase [Acidipropionibacterium jensenii]VEI03019.1 Serine/threonine-protein kinase pknB [Acidipropionibacterium jensenii]